MMQNEEEFEEAVMANVTLRHIYKVYAGGVTAVNDFNLVIKDKDSSFWSVLPAAENPLRCAWWPVLKKFPRVSFISATS